MSIGDNPYLGRDGYISYSEAIKDTVPQVVVNPSVDIPNEDGWYPDRTRRVAVLWIDECHLLDACISFFTGRNQPEYELRLRIGHDEFISQLKVGRVSHDPFRRAFGVLLHHPSFAPVPDGCMPPDMEYGLRKLAWEWVQVKNEGK